MKYPLVFLCLFLVYSGAFGQKVKVTAEYMDIPNVQETDSIYYSPNRKLMWSDYQEANNSGYAAGALTSTNIGYTTDIKDEDGKTSMNIGVFAYFSRSGSWRKPSTVGGLALNHEQKHFDLAYLSALRFVDYLKTAKFKEKNYKKLVNQIYIQVFKENQAVQQAYDQGTEYGANIQAQLEWDKNIQDMMEKQLAKDKKD